MIRLCSVVFGVHHLKTGSRPTDDGEVGRGPIPLHYFLLDRKIQWDSMSTPADRVRFVWACIAAAHLRRDLRSFVSSSSRDPSIFIAAPLCYHGRVSKVGHELGSQFRTSQRAIARFADTLACSSLLAINRLIIFLTSNILQQCQICYWHGMLDTHTHTTRHGYSLNNWP